MPLVRVSIQRGRTPEQKQAIADALYEAMRETINIPENDRFIFIDEKAPEDVFVDKNFLTTGRTPEAVLVEITLRAGRTNEMKEALYHRIAEKLHHAVNVASADVIIILHENQSADWSFSSGVAQYLH